MDTARVERLIEWLINDGGFLQQGVEIVFSEAQGYHLRALQDFDNTKPVVQVPRHLTISLATIDRARNPWPAFYLEKFADEPYILTRFLLVDEFLHGEASWWWPYISLLPQPSDDPWSPPFNTAPWFSKEDLKWIKGTGIHSAVEQRDAFWHREYQAGLEFLKDMPKIDSYSWSLYKWAATILSSRCFPNCATNEKMALNADVVLKPDASVDGTGQQSILATNFPVLVPVLDIANHDPKANVLWIINETGYKLQTSEKVSPGSQIYNNYGAKSNEELLMGYGFVLENNPADTLGIKFSLPDTPQKHRAREILQQGEPFPLRIILAQLEQVHRRYSEFTPAVDVFYLHNDKPLPPTLFDTIRLAVMNERELKQLCVGLDPKSQRLSIQAWSQLYLALKQRGVMLLASKAFSNHIPESARQQAALVYTRSQQDIVQHHKRALLGIFEQFESFDQVWTLDDLLASTTFTLSEPLRKMTRAVIGTQNPNKLCKQGFHDILMTIVVCLCWLASEASMQLDVEDTDHQRSTKGGKIFHRWVEFIRTTYCPPPGFAGTCQGVNCHCAAANRQQWTISDGNAQQSAIIEQAYSIMQRALLLSDLDSIFDSAQSWSHDFISWGYGIWSAEAITWVREDDDQSEPAANDQEDRVLNYERALFLEHLT